MKSKKTELVVSQTPFQRHIAKWKGGCGATICETATKRVFARGTVPCEILFVGEGPGKSEGIIGKPFVGPAGKLLDHIIRQSVPEGMTFALTNLVCCIPFEEVEGKRGEKATEPDDDSVISCGVRLTEFVTLCNPKLIVCVGKLAEGWLDTKYKHHINLPLQCREKGCRELKKYNEQLDSEVCKNGHVGTGVYPPRVAITHPSAILRSNIAQQGMAVRRCIVTIASAIQDLEAGDDPNLP